MLSVLGDTEKVCRCITAGLFPNAAYLHYSGVYRTVRGDQELYIHPTSVLYTLEQPKWYVNVFISVKCINHELFDSYEMYHNSLVSLLILYEEIQAETKLTF
jgi:hypothetical protein